MGTDFDMEGMFAKFPAVATTTSRPENVFARREGASLMAEHMGNGRPAR
jgi:hypothetical protein